MYVTSPISQTASEIVHPFEVKLFDDKIGGKELSLSVGDNLFFAGDDADYVYEVVEGVIRSSKVLMDGRRQVLNFCYPGEIIGLSHDSIYHCDCDAVSNVKVRLYKKNAFMKDVAEDPEFCAQLLRQAAAEVNHMQDHFLMLGCKSALEKLASFLVAIMNRQPTKTGSEIVFDLPMKRSDIADFLGITIETVSRNLTKLRKLGAIDVPNTHQVKVLRPGLLRGLAENDI